MSLPYPLPTDNWPTPITQDYQDGWVVWSLQRAINRFHDSFNEDPNPPATVPARIAEDYHFGPETLEAVKLMQQTLRKTGKTDLRVDGVVDIATQRRIVKHFTGDVPWLWPSNDVYKNWYQAIPRGLLYSIAEGESAYMLGSASWNSSTNVDLGVWQDNVTGNELQEMVTVMRGFDVRIQAAKEALDLTKWYNANHSLPGCAPASVDPSLWAERAWRRAAMHHNRPLDANVLARFTIDQLESPAAKAYERQQLDGGTPDPWTEPLG